MKKIRKVKITVEVDEETHQAIVAQYGECELAQLFLGLLTADIVAIVDDFRNCQERPE